MVQCGRFLFCWLVVLFFINKIKYDNYADTKKHGLLIMGVFLYVHQVAVVNCINIGLHAVS